MAGGNFDVNTPKVRPGVYINFKAQKNYSSPNPIKGIAVVPLVGYDWGPNGEMVTLTNTAPDGEMVKLGRSIYSDNDLVKLIRLAFYNSSTVIAYIISGGKQSSGTSGNLTVTAVYAGTRGNDITITSVESVDGGYDVSLYLDGEKMEEVNGIHTIEELIKNGSNYVTYSGEGELSAFAGLTLTGGSNDTNTNASFATFLDKVEKIKANTVCIPVTDESLLTAAASKVKYLRTKVGKTIQFVMPNYEGDDIGIINVVNSFVVDSVPLTVAQACAWVTGATAGADNITSNTCKVVADATAVVGEMSNEESCEAIKSGKFFFTTSDSGEVIVEYDINSLVTVGSNQDESYKKNRVIRTFDTFADDLLATFPPGKFNNDPTNWEIMKGLGKSLLQKYEDVGAIRNVDYDADFEVDQSRSSGESTYFNIYIQPADSAEKLYFSISTQ